MQKVFALKRKKMYNVCNSELQISKKYHHLTPSLMEHSRLSSERRIRVLSVGLTATLALYALVVFVAEPMKTLGATTADTIVQFTVTSALSVTCSTTSTLGSAAGNGTSGTGAMATAYCTPITNNSTGYTLSWIILTGSGAPAVHANCTSAAPCYGTGHLLSNNVTSGYPDAIHAFDRKLGFINSPGRFDSTTIGTGSGSRWAARLRANSTTVGGASVSWGADSSTEGFLNVATGSAVNIAKRTSETSSTGDIENFLFKVVIPSGAFQPTGTYKSTIRFTVVDN